MSTSDIQTDRRTVITALGSVAAGSMIAGCSTGEDTPDLSIENVWMEITETNQLKVYMEVKNSGDETGEPIGRVRVKRDDKLIGEKKQRLVVFPGGDSLELEGRFVASKKNASRSEYTASGTLPDRDWVTASES